MFQRGVMTFGKQKIVILSFFPYLRQIFHSPCEVWVLFAVLALLFTINLLAIKNAVVFSILFLLSGICVFAQVGINIDNSAPDSSAMLDVNSNNKGALIYSNGSWRTFTPCTPFAPAAGAHVSLMFRIVWNWVAVPGAAGYKWNTINDYTSAVDMGTGNIKAEPGLACNTPYTRYVWAYNGCGNSTPVSLTQTTLACFPCGDSITVNHTAGVVAPVSKTVTYHTVTNIPGELSKCWINSNLGADHQAIAVNDAAEASAGWYWQFNRK